MFKEVYSLFLCHPVTVDAHRKWMVVGMLSPKSAKVRKLAGSHEGHILFSPFTVPYGSFCVNKITGYCAIIFI